MINKGIIKYLLLLCLLNLSNLVAQNKFNTIAKTDTLLINLSNKYKISAISFVPFSEKIKLAGKILNTNEYSFDYRQGSFSLSDSLEYSIFDTIFISYEMILLNLQKEYKKRSLVYRFDENILDTIKVVKSISESLTPKSIFGEGIQKSGTILRGFTVGTNKDFTVDSGLRLQLSGRLSDDIEIVAALTDENTPIQPEGNTETLEELDKVEPRNPLFDDEDFYKKFKVVFSKNLFSFKTIQSLCLDIPFKYSVLRG